MNDGPFRGREKQAPGLAMNRDFQSTPVRVVIVDDHRLFVDALALLLVGITLVVVVVYNRWIERGRWAEVFR